MVAQDKLRGLIAERGLSQCQVAKTLGMTPKTFYAKLKKGVFDSDEISQMIALLNIAEPMRIFFAELGT